MGVILTALFAVISANALWELLSILVSGIVGEKEKDMSDKYVTLDEFMNERGEWVKQVVYKVDGDFNGDIKGENVTVILMGNGNINGNIDAKNGEVFVHHGNINGNVKADKVLCPTLSNNEHVKHNPAKDVESPTLPTKKELTCLDCIHCHLGFETMYCSVSNKVIRNLTPCIRFKGK